MSLTDPHYWQRWLPVVLGVFTGIFTVVHALVDQDSLLGYAQELTLPVALSLSLVFLGTRLAHSDLDTASFRQIDTWIAIGMAAFGFLGIWMFAHRVLMEGLPLDEGMHELTTSFASGALAGTVVGIYDTRRQRYQDELELAETVIQSTIDGVAVLDSDDRYVSVNQSYAEMYGNDTTEHLVGEQWGYLTTEDNRERFEEEICPSLTETGAWRGEAVVRRTDGSTISAELSITELEDGGRVIVARDITERKTHERELHRRSTAMNASMDGIAILNEEGVYTYVNEAHADVYGYDDPDAIVGETWHMCYTDQELPYFEEEVMPTLWAEGQWRGEATGKRKDGSLFPQELTLTALDEGGLVCVVRDITERKEHERKLERSEDLLETTQEMAAVGGWEYDLRTDEVRWTDGINRIYGLPLDFEPDLDSALDYYHPEDFPELEDAIERAVEDGESYDLELRLVTANDELRWVRVRGEPHQESGETVLLRGAIQDITEQKVYERTLTSLHEGTRAMMAAETPEEVSDIAVEAARDALDQSITTLWLHDGDDALEPVASTEEADALFEEIPTYRAGNSLSWQAFAESEVLVCEDVAAVSSVHNPDTKIWSELIVPLGEYGVLNSGSTVRTEFSDADITAVRILAANTEAALERAEREELLHEREAQLERERDRFSALFENVPDPGVTVEFTDGEPTVQTVNPAFEEVFGYAAEAAVGEALNDLIVPSDQLDEAQSMDEKAMQNEQVIKEVRRRTANGRLRDFLFRNVSIESDMEKRAFGIYTDITDQKRRERELERQNEQLERFASLISHDLRNPLTVATGYLELLDTGEGEREYRENIENAHDRMDRIIADVLALARQGKTVGETSPVELTDVAEAAWSHVESIDARLVVEDGLGTVRADRSRLESLFENLFRNAIEHGTEDVTCRVGAMPEGFYVEDDGPGIPADEREEVFEYGHTTNDSGTGLGLSIVSTIAEAHGWTVSITDSESGGARFEFSLQSISSPEIPYAEAES